LDGQRPGSNSGDDAVAGEKKVLLLSISGWLLHACPLTVCIGWPKGPDQTEMIMQWQVRENMSGWWLHAFSSSVHCMDKGPSQTEMIMHWQVRENMPGWWLHACSLTVCIGWPNTWCELS
jgi:hypothetical protein